MGTRRKFLHCSAIAGAATVVGCGDSDSGADAGADAALPDAPADAFVGTDATESDVPGEDAGTVVPNGLSPVLLRFRVTLAEPSRVYFDSSKVVAGTTTEGFSITGKTITAIEINSSGTLEHYFTVDSPFTFWDNNTIRYEGGSNLGDAEGRPVHEFTLTLITNETPEPDAPADRYVAADASGRGDGLGEASAWTLAQAADQAAPGQTVWIKAGDYVGSEFALTEKNGSVTQPIKFVGYTRIRSDIVAPMVDSFDYVNPGQAKSFVDPAIYPVVSRTSQRREFAIRLTNCSHLVLRNLCARNSEGNIQIRGNSDSILVDNCLSSNAQTGGTLFGRGIEATLDTTRLRLTRCISFDSALGNYYVNGVGHLLLGCKSSSGEFVSGGADSGTDYYLAISQAGSGIIFKNNEVRRVGNPRHKGHGTGGKSTRGEVSYCLWEGNSLYNVQNGIYFVDRNTHDNVAKNNRYAGDPEFLDMHALVVRNGAYNNIYEGNEVSDVKVAISFWTDTETADFASDTDTGVNNLYRNNIFRDFQRGIQMKNSNHTGNTTQVKDNQIVNNTFYSSESMTSYFFWYDSPLPMTFANNHCVNNLVYGCRATAAIDSQWSLRSGGYYLCEDVPEGNLEADPEFMDLSGLVPQSPALNNGEPLPIVRYDKNGKERYDPPTIGAVDITEPPTD